MDSCTQAQKSSQWPCRQDTKWNKSPVEEADSVLPADTPGAFHFLMLVDVPPLPSGICVCELFGNELLKHRVSVLKHTEEHVLLKNQLVELLLYGHPEESFEDGRSGNGSLRGRGHSGRLQPRGEGLKDRLWHQAATSLPCWPQTRKLSSWSLNFLKKRE